MLKRTPSLTGQAKSHIKERILSDEFVEGRIPSETVLAAELGVSRTTIRDALSRLEQEGVIYRKQGAGTFVNSPGLQIKSRLEEIWHYEAMLEAHGYTPSTQILSVTEMPAFNGTSPHLHIKKLFLADNEPVILTFNDIPVNLIEKQYKKSDFRQPIPTFLQDKCRQNLSYYLSEIVPVVVDGENAGILYIPTNTPLISFKETGYNDDNQPILKSTSYFRDDLLRLRLIRRET